MNHLRDLPNTKNFRFVGIDSAGDQHDCIVGIDPIGCYSVYRISDRAPFFMSLVGWERAPDRQGNRDE